MQIVEAITAAIREQWPYLTVECTQPPSPTPATDRHKIQIHYPFPAQNANIWVGDIEICGESIKLNILPSMSGQPQYTYQNVLSDPASLDELYTILDTHIQDVKEIIPETRHEFPKTNEPTDLELKARKTRKAITLPHRLPSQVEVRKWGD